MEQSQDWKYNGIFSVVGPPGTGKTRWLSKQVESLNSQNMTDSGFKRRENPVMVCSLTKTAAQEVAGRVDLPKKSVGTLHAHAFAALNYPDVASDDKLTEWNKANPAMMLSGGVTQDVDDMTRDADAMKNSEADKINCDYHTLRARMVDRTLWPSPIKAFAVRWEQWKRDTGNIDFTDMIEAAAELPPPGNPGVILADEAQDLSNLEWKLLQNWSAHAGCCMVVGDPWQALYDWRGAHPELFYDKAIPEDHRRVLRQSYRVAVRPHAAAVSVISNLSDYRPVEYMPTAEMGAVDEVNAGVNDTRRIISIADEHLSAGKTLMIQVSCSYMLPSIITAFKSAGIPFGNPWRRKRGDWNPMGGGTSRGNAGRLAAFLCALQCEPQRHWSGDEFAAWAKHCRVDGGLFLRGHRDDILEAASIAGGKPFKDYLHGMDEAQYERLAVASDLPRAKGIPALARMWADWQLAAQRKTADYPVRVVDRVGFKGVAEAPKVFLGTIHSFKGAEADTTLVFPDLSRSGAAQWESGPAGRDSILRAFYVAMTRPKSRLIMGAPSGYLPAGLRNILRGAVAAGNCKSITPF